MVLLMQLEMLLGDEFSLLDLVKAAAYLQPLIFADL